MGETSGTAAAWWAEDFATISAGDRVDALVALERQVRWLQARQARVLAAMADDRALTAGADPEWVREDVRAALGETAVGAGDRLRVAELLTDALPRTLAALERGVISYRHARYLADQVLGLPRDVVAKIEKAVLAEPAAPVGLTTFRRRVRRAVLAADPRAARQRHAAAVEDRRVCFRPVADGMTELWALLPAEGAAALRSSLDAAARPTDGDDRRSADQRRADALIQLALDDLAGGCAHCGGRPGQLRPSIQVSVALSTLLDLDDQPGELDGHGPIPAELARRIAADPSGTWRRLVTDPRGRLIDYGRTVYTPPAPLRRHVVARDRSCRFPGCGRVADRCELDHVIAWADGGPTNDENLAALCPRHHHLKHEGGWRLRRFSDGSVEWTSPTGHRYPVGPGTYPVDGTRMRAPGDSPTDSPTDSPADEAGGPESAGGPDPPSADAA